VAKQWHRVASSDAICGSGPVAVRIGDLALALVRLRGKLFAVEDQCPHMRHPLSRGMVRDDKLICSWHHWEFDLLQEQSWVNPEMRCVSYPVREREGEIEVELDPLALPEPPGGFPRGRL
jgi:nitrite reductase/ring-hydroxylating ferredoxin subunit